MEIQGVIKHVLPAREGVSANGPWKTASYVIETEERYPRRMVFDVRDGREGRIERLNIQEGKRMKVWFDVDASEYQGRWYNNVTAWDAREVEADAGSPAGKLQGASGDAQQAPEGETGTTQQSQPQQTKVEMMEKAEEAASGKEGSEDDLPF